MALFGRKEKSQQRGRHYILMTYTTEDGESHTLLMTPHKARELDNKLQKALEPSGIRAAERGH